jgi:homoserine dehydrogenase
VKVPIVVLKFGSSVLGSDQQIPDVVHEVYRHYREGNRVVVIVSAFAGVTERIFAEAAGNVESADPHAFASWVGTGEQVASAKMVFALCRYGISARLLEASALKLTGAGGALDADLCNVSLTALADALSQVSVVVIPGFIAQDASGRSVLLGRGGSDQSALFIAHALGACCTLMKDVAGVYDHDPQLVGPSTRRFPQVSWEYALEHAGTLIQPKAMRFAREAQQAFRVATLSASVCTGVGDTMSEAVPLAEIRAPMEVILLGLGTVGLGVYHELVRRPDLFTVKRIAVRSRARHLAIGIPGKLLTTDVRDALKERAQVVIEVMGGLEAPHGAIQDALQTGRSVVTANKSLMAQHGPALEAVAHACGQHLLFGAAVGGAVPMIEWVRQTAAEWGDEDPVQEVRGVLNGTCNYIIDQICAGLTFEEAVAMAQARGFAEADPTADLSGRDSAEKLIILSRFFAETGVVPDSVTIRGLTPGNATLIRESRQRGTQQRMVASYRVAGQAGDLQVGLQQLLPDDYLASCKGEENRLEIRSTRGQVKRLQGLGAGRMPTTASVMADLLQLSRAQNIE